jgi:hypothetical protein
MKSPFQFGKIVEGPAFTDREDEVNRLVSNFENNVNTLLISPRRWGKSSLVKKASEAALQKNPLVKFCFIDLYSVRDENEFYSLFAREVIKATSKKVEDWMAHVKSFLGRISPRISFGPDPVHDFDIHFDFNRKTDTYDEILNLPEKISNRKKMKIVVCIDEFQNLIHFQDPLLFQKRLRAVWQKHQHTVYCLYGSKRSMLMHIFENKSMPFYRFGDVFYLEKIEKGRLTAFVMQCFVKTQKRISEPLAGSIVDSMQCHPYYVQQLAHLVWTHTDKTVDEPIIEFSLDELIRQNSMLFENEIERLSNTQIRFLEAVASDKETAFSSKEILEKYQLGTSGNVVKIKSTLQKKEIIDFVQSKPVYIDPVFELWMKRNYMGKR